MALNLLGMKAIPLQSLPDRGFTPSVDGCRTLIGPKKGNHPRNPTGTTYSPALITAFASLAREKKSSPHHRRNIERFYYHRLSASHALLNFDRSSSVAKYLPFIHLFSFSKLYCLPGHRLGAIAASPQLLASIISQILCSGHSKAASNQNTHHSRQTCRTDGASARNMDNSHSSAIHFPV